MTFGAHQGSRVVPLVWNVVYDDFLRIVLPARTRIIGLADDALVVCAADNVGILDLLINDSLWRAKRWLDSRGLKMAPEKTEALLVTDRRSFQYPMQEIARPKEAIRKDERRRLVEKWQKRWHGDQSRRWTHRLIPELTTWLDKKHGQVGFHLAQALSGHGCFNAHSRSCVLGGLG